MKENPDTRLTVAGKSDTRGAKEKNDALARERAKVAVGELERLGIPSTRFDIVDVTEGSLCGVADESCWFQQRVVTFAPER
jgi:outer membrane protein OmpA-like peptidoglycan-associated protein